MKQLAQRVADGPSY
jgi:hypothetical protein